MKSLIYYMHDESSAFRFVLNGDLSQETARDLEQARVTASSVLAARPLIFDVTAVTSIDPGGRQLLRSWHMLGAQLTVASPAGLRRLRSISEVPVTVRSTGGRTPNWLPPRAMALWLAALLTLFSVGGVISAVARIQTRKGSAGASLLVRCVLASRLSIPEGTLC